MHPDDFQALVDVTQFLLDAGSEKYRGIGSCSLDILVNKTHLQVSINNHGWSSLHRLTCLDAVKTYCELTLKLVELFLKHGKHYNLVNFMASIMFEASRCVRALWEDENDEVCPNVVKIELYGFQHIFRRFLIAGKGVISTNIDWNTFIAPGKATEIYLVIAGHSFDHPYSNRLIQLMLSGLTCTQVNQLRKLAIAYRNSESNKFSDALRACKSRALEMICGTESPHSLQHHARRAILLAVSGRTLPSAEVLEIPVHLRKYFLEFM